MVGVGSLPWVSEDEADGMVKEIATLHDYEGL
jgi:hypothetical protein